jgi:uncharacterized membrane protein
MARVEASVEIGAPLAEVWDLYFDRARWAAWVDQFGSVVSESGYPGAGGELVWRSGAAGRGAVTELVRAHEPRSLHRIEFEDPQAAGELETRFEMRPAGEGGERSTRVAQRLDYRLTTGGPLRAVTDLLFIRSQMRGSLQRSLSDLRLEAERSGSSRVQPG